MLIDFLWLIFGLALLVGGGDTLVRGASGLAKAFRISPLIIGLTIVAFGTSAPELAVNILASWRGDGMLSFGNIIGSNLANMGLVLGCAALIMPLQLRSVMIKREIPMMILATLVVCALALVAMQGAMRPLGKIDGAILLAFFAYFLFYTARDVMRQREQDEYVQELAASKHAAWSGSAVNVLFFLVGLVALIFGGNLCVNAATSIAEIMEVSQALIGLTIVAVGTSLPELVTAIMACRRDETDLAVGNVIGSNIFNLLLVLPLTTISGSVPIPAEGIFDLTAVLILSVLLLPIAITNKRRIMRKEGGLLLIIYLGYMLWRIFTGG